ncbi:PfkB family carbohydrate kinase [Amylibacter sp.]|nr:PfkB family carbohydrate kinase [Amylibacter sp.]
MAKYKIYGVGATLVDTEVVFSVEFLKQNAIEKSVMTLVDESRQAELLKVFRAYKHHLIKKSGGSACNTVTAVANLGAKTFFSCKVAAEDDGKHFAGDLADFGVTFHTDSPEEGVIGKCFVMVTGDAERTKS